MIKIDGKHYSKGVTHKRKKEAQSGAAYYRKQGRNARVIKNSKGYTVYFR